MLQAGDSTTVAPLLSAQHQAGADAASANEHTSNGNSNSYRDKAGQRDLRRVTAFAKGDRIVMTKSSHEVKSEEWKGKPLSR